MFHTVTDWYSAYVSSRVTGLPYRPHLVFVDGHCKVRPGKIRPEPARPDNTVLSPHGPIILLGVLGSMISGPCWHNSPNRDIFFKKKL